MTDAPGLGNDLGDVMRRGMAAVGRDRHAQPRRSQSSRGATSDLSIDEILLLHSIGWEPVDLVTGASIGSIPRAIWSWGIGEIVQATEAHTQALATAVERIRGECRQVGGYGIVGVKVDFEVHSHHVDVVLLGTAVRPCDANEGARTPFVSDLTTRDFALLDQAGWLPVGLAFGASYVHAPRRSVGTTISQRGQNIELTNFTEALYDARESAMERMQGSALHFGAAGVVAVRIAEGPMYFAHHAIGFVAWGTAVVPGPGGHRYIRPRVVVPLDDRVRQFEARSLKG